MKLFGDVFAPHDAARLASGFFMAATLAFLALACLELMGERAMRVGVLLFIGCVGLLARAHEMIADLAGLTGIAMAIYGLALADRRPVAGGAVAGIGAGIAFLGNGFLPLGMLVMLLGLLPLAAPLWRTRRYALDARPRRSRAPRPLVAAWLVALGQRIAGGAAGVAAGRVRHALELALRRRRPRRAPLLRAHPALVRVARLAARRVDALALAPHARGAAQEVLLPLVAFVAFFIMTSVFGEPREVNAIPLLMPLAILAWWSSTRCRAAPRARSTGSA